MNVLLLGAGGNAGRNYVECLKLGDPEIRVVGVDPNPYHLAACNSDVKILKPPEGTDLVNSYYGLVETYNIDFIHAQPDREVRFLLSNHEFDELITRGNIDSWYIFNDKLVSQNIWERESLVFPSHSGLNIPPTKLEAMLAQGEGRIWIRAVRGAGSKAALPVSSLDQAQSWAQYWMKEKGMKSFDFMLSPHLPGREYAVQTFWKDGEIRHAQARERIEYFFGEQMPSGQSSTPSVAKIVSDYPGPYIPAYKAIKAVDPKPHGIYCVDLKTSADGRIMPTEVNYGRYFTTSNFFARLGMNTPYSELLNHVFGGMDTQVNYLPDDIYWLRGLDMEPRLVTEDEIFPS